MNPYAWQMPAFFKSSESSNYLRDDVRIGCPLHRRRLRAHTLSITSSATRTGDSSQRNQRKDPLRPRVTQGANSARASLWVYGGGPTGSPTMNETEPEEVDELTGMQYASLPVSGVPATLHSQFVQDGGLPT
jgi:hypothetical protein